MSTPTLPDTDTDVDVEVTVTDEADPVPAPARRRRLRRRRRRTWRTSRFAYALVAPAVFFMVLVHVLLAGGGVLLSFKKLQTFTFSQLYGAPGGGLPDIPPAPFRAR